MADFSVACLLNGANNRVKWNEYTILVFQTNCIDIDNIKYNTAKYHVALLLYFDDMSVH